MRTGLGKIVISRPRGRPPKEDPAAKLARLQQETAAALAVVQEMERDKFAMLGQAVAARAGKDAAFRERLFVALNEHVPSSKKRAELTALLEATA